MNQLRILASLVGVLGSVASAGCGSDSSSGSDATLRVVNRSDFAITEIHVTDVGSSTWGPNLVSGDLLAPGESLTLGVDCSTYDALIVDEDGVDCEVHDVDLCLNDASWIIRNETCSVFGAARAAREAAAKASAASGSATPTR
jgi:hypothetical protein